MIVAFSGPHRSGKTYLAQRVVAKAIESGHDARLVPSPAGAVFRELGIDPSAILDFDTRLRVQHAVLARFIENALAVFNETERRNAVIVFDRTPLDLLTYMLADTVSAAISESRIAALAEYQRACVKTFAVCEFSQLFIVHTHPDLPFVDEPLKGRNDRAHLRTFDTILTTLAITVAANMRTRVTDIPNSIPLANRERFVECNIVKRSETEQ